MPPPKGERFEYEGAMGERTEAIVDGLVKGKWRKKRKSVVRDLIL